MNDNALILQNLTIGYGTKTVLGDITLSIPARTTTSLIGANGTGKSTLLKTISGILRPITGKVLLNGKDLSDISRKELARQLAIVYTDRVGSAGGLTVRELVEMGRHPYTGLLGRLDRNDRRIVDRALSDLGIMDKADSFLSDISDGERQKAMIARALAQETPLIVLDEPTSFLDAASRLEILELIKSLSREHGRTVILSTHDIATSLSVSDCVITVCPTLKPTVELTEPFGESFEKRMNQVFSGRGVTFNSDIREFVK